MDKPLQPLIPHAYPLWIKVGTIASFILLAVCLFDLPYYVTIHHKMRRAHNAFRCGNYQVAGTYYAELTSLIPLSKNVKIRAAESFFKSPAADDHSIALNFLKSVSLNTNEWQELLAYMPEHYKDHFTQTEECV